MDPNAKCCTERQFANSLITWDLNGRGERIRTSDPLVPNQVRYQTALRPECCCGEISVKVLSVRLKRAGGLLDRCTDFT
jgi:hypothetical protein